MNTINSGHTPKEGFLHLCQNYRIISLISHPSNIVLKIVLNRLQPQAQELIAEEQASFRAGRSTNEQIFNLRLLSEKHLHQGTVERATKKRQTSLSLTSSLRAFEDRSKIGKLSMVPQHVKRMVYNAYHRKY